MVSIFWCHRILRKTDESYGDITFGIVECYHDEENDKIIGWTGDFIEPFGESVEELRESLDWMLDAFDKPVLDEVELLAQFEQENLIPFSFEDPETTDSLTLDPALD